MATPGPVRFCPACGSGRIDIAYGERSDEVVGTIICLDTYCGNCGWSGHIEPDVDEWEGDRWKNTWFIKQ